MNALPDTVSDCPSHVTVREHKFSEGSDFDLVVTAYEGGDDEVFGTFGHPDDARLYARQLAQDLGLEVRL